MSKINRRDWLTAAAGMGAGFGLLGPRWGRSEESGMTAETGYTLPIYQVSGSDYRELGRAIGRAAGDRIRAGFEARREWIDKLTKFMETGPAERKTPFVKAIQEEFPRLWDELEGIAEGSGVPLANVLAACLNPELSTLMKGVTFYEDCTTVAVNAGGRLWVGHNEDGSCAYRDFMYLLDITYPDHSRSLCLSYPGYWPGNAPSVNSHGLVQTVNYIAGQTLKPGVPRYALDRAIMEAKTMDEAVAIATHPRRAYSQHHLLVSTAEKKIVSVETAVERTSVLPVSGVFVHANHFIHPAMRDVPQFPLQKGSSVPRQMAAESWRDSHPDPARLTPEDLRLLLADHDLEPLSICRHSNPDLPGCTLAAIIIQAETGSITFHDGPACHNHRREYPWPKTS